MKNTNDRITHEELLFQVKNRKSPKSFKGLSFTEFLAKKVADKALSKVLGQ